MIRREFRVMNTEALVLVRPGNAGAEADAGQAIATIQDYETRFSRFQATSDLGRLNEDPCEDVAVSHELALLIARVLGYARLTDGVFDPVVLADLKAAGYDRSFECVLPDAMPLRLPTRVFRWLDVTVDLETDRIRRPAGAMIDLGGVAKGAAADAAAATLARQPGALVDLGGDVRTTGRPDDSRRWGIGLDDGLGDQRAIVRLEGGAVATSTVRKRRWLRGGQTQHHIIDPRSGVPAASDAVQCSVIADTAEHAEVAAKVGLIMGVHSLYEGDLVAEALGVTGVAWITQDDEYVPTPGWRKQCA